VHADILACDINPIKKRNRVDRDPDFMISTAHSFIRYALVGAVNTLIGMSVIFVAWRFLALGDLTANLLGYAVGFCCSYGLNRWWTFSDRAPVARSLWRFALACAVAYGANLVVLFASREALGPATFLPHVAGAVTYTAIGYLGSRFFAFRSPPGSHLADVSPPA
jgi:putative flippase GtrA